ncbi:MAG: hypothetical protein GX796_03400 [Clostridiaceae bacterium]|nr:hypothetical protein [Clostridiaceae bacterium]
MVRNLDDNAQVAAGIYLAKFKPAINRHNNKELVGSASEKKLSSSWILTGMTIN